MKQTAVGWLVTRISHGGLVSKKQFDELVNHAKRMEKEQKIAFANKYAEEVLSGCLLSPTEFFNESLKQNFMSTTFGICREPLHIELGDENGIFFYIDPNIFEKVWFRSLNNSRWLSESAKGLPDDTRVYALDNSQQGIYTIGDIKKSETFKSE